MADATELAELKKLIQQQAYRIGVLEDVAEIRNLQHMYGYYLDKCHYTEVVELFTDDAIAMFHGGIWKGKEGVKRLYIGRFQAKFTAGRNGPIDGFLLDHPQLQDVIHVAPDRLTALFRGRSFMQAGRHSEYPADPNDKTAVPRQWWEGGIYENTFARASVNDPWRIHVFNYHPIWHGDFETGWAHTKPNYVPFPTVLYPEDPAGPDEMQDQEARYLWPETHTMPYHWLHPITGEARPSKEELRSVPMQVAIEQRDGLAAKKKQTNGANGSH